jgi:hypothetical protein
MYIILNSNNEWLDTLRTKKDALEVFKEREEELKEEKDDTELYLYQAKEIKHYQF